MTDLVSSIKFMRSSNVIISALAVFGIIGCQGGPSAKKTPDFSSSAGYAKEPGKKSEIRGPGLKKLKEVLAVYGKAKTFTAKSAWTFEANGKKKDKATSDRAIFFLAPNKHRIEAKTGSMSFTSVSDGRTVLENSGASYEQTWATESFAKATAPIVSDPQLAGSMLYKFFGGESALEDLVDPKTEVELLQGQAAGTTVVRFFATGDFGTTEVTIGEKNLITEIRSKFEPLVKQTSELPEDSKLTSLLITEKFSGIMMDTPLKPDAFVATAPKGVKVKDSRIAKSAVAEEGSLAPDFTLGGGEKSFKLSDLRGDVVMICFWSPNQGIGSKQMLNVVGKAVTDFEPKGLRVLSVTNVEGALSDLTLEETRTKGLFPVMYDKNGTVIKAFGLRKPDDQVDSLPALFVIDRKGVVTKIFFQVPTRTEISEALESAGF